MWTKLTPATQDIVVEAAACFRKPLSLDDLIDTLPPVLRRLKALASSFGMLKDT